MGYFGTTSGLLCGNFGYMKVPFKKTFIFPVDFNDFTSNSDHFGIDLGSLGVTLGSFLAYGGTLDPCVKQFDVEKHEVSSVMSIYASLVSPKSENVEKVLVFIAFL